MIARNLSDQDSSMCPECDGPITPVTTANEAVCDDCGLVVAEDRLDRGPEWRAFDAKENEEKCRVGALTTVMKHDKGLSTIISWADMDANGRSLSPRKRTQMQRLRKWDERYRTRDCAERHLKQALGELNRIAGALGLPQSVRETACVIYRQAHDDNLLVGRSIEGVAAASVYAAARQEKIPRTLDEVTTVARVNCQRIARAYRAVTGELELAIEPADPTAYLPRFASEVGCSNATQRTAHEILETIIGTAYTGGKNPVGLAAAALYASACLTDERITQQEISEVADVSCMTIRTHYRELQDRYE